MDYASFQLCYFEIVEITMIKSKALPCHYEYQRDTKRAATWTFPLRKNRWKKIRIYEL